MATEKRPYSDLPIPPGYYLAEVLAELGMTQAGLARRIGRPTQAINEIVKGEKAITPATALQLERAIGVPAHIWTGLEGRYQLVQARTEERRQLQRELTYLERVPYKQLADLGCVLKTRDKENKIRELHGFYGVSSLANVPEVGAFAASFRIAGTRLASDYALAAWIRCAELRAAKLPVGVFDKSELARSLAGIRPLSRKDSGEFVPELKGLLARCGVSLVLLPHFPKTYAHGATFWPRPDRAVLTMSIRGKWADVFWFSLFHEIGHLVLHRKVTFIDSDKVLPELAGQEKEANEFAANALIAPQSFGEFIRKKDFSGEAIRAFAREIDVSFGIVIGRLQHEGLVPQQSDLNRLRERFDWAEK
jgi:HTH-type transcriptional regulator/antitoxin HigA